MNFDPISYHFFSQVALFDRGKHLRRILFLALLQDSHSTFVIIRFGPFSRLFIYLTMCVWALFMHARARPPTIPSSHSLFFFFQNADWVFTVGRAIKLLYREIRTHQLLMPSILRRRPNWMPRTTAYWFSILEVLRIVHTIYFIL